MACVVARPCIGFGLAQVPSQKRRGKLSRGRCGEGQPSLAMQMLATAVKAAAKLLLLLRPTFLQVPFHFVGRDEVVLVAVDLRPVPDFGPAGRAEDGNAAAGDL